MLTIYFPNGKSKTASPFHQATFITAFNLWVILVSTDVVSKDSGLSEIQNLPKLPNFFMINST